MGTIHTLVLALVLHPHVQRKAQEEIDRVVGSQRLPDFGDRDSLPYVQCVANEVMRYVSRSSALNASFSLTLATGGTQLHLSVSLLNPQIVSVHSRCHFLSRDSPPCDGR